MTESRFTVDHQVGEPRVRVDQAIAGGRLAETLEPPADEVDGAGRGGRDRNRRGRARRATAPSGGLSPSIVSKSQTSRTKPAGRCQRRECSCICAVMRPSLRNQPTRSEAWSGSRPVTKSKATAKRSGRPPGDTRRCTNEPSRAAIGAGVLDDVVGPQRLDPGEFGADLRLVAVADAVDAQHEAAANRPGHPGGRWRSPRRSGAAMVERGPRPHRPRPSRTIASRSTRASGLYSPPSAIDLPPAPSAAETGALTGA